MSIQKVIGNYYVDLLDFLNTKERKYQSLDTFFTNARYDEQKQFVSKLGSIYQRIQVLAETQKSYWNGKRGTYIIYIVVLATLLVVLGGLTGWFFMNKYKYDILLQADGVKTFMLALVHLIVYFVFASVFILLLYNVVELLRRTNKFKSEAYEGITRMKDLYGLSLDAEKVLLYTGYRNTGNVKQCNSLENGDDSALISRFVGKSRQVAKGNETGSDLLDRTFDTGVLGTGGGAKELKDVNYTVVFSFLKNEADIVNKTKLLYANGEGYKTLKKQLILSSNALMLHEFKRIMEYYFKVVKRKDTNDDQIVQMDKAQLHDTLDKHVVDIIIDSDIYKPVNPSAFRVPVDYIPLESQKNDQTISVSAIGKVEYRKNVLADVSSATGIQKAFIEKYKMLKELYGYTLVYMSQIYFQKLATANDFNLILKAKMPMYIDPGHASDDKNMELYKHIKTTFTNHYENVMMARIKNISASSTESLYEKTLMELKDIFDEFYLNAMKYIRGDYYFPFDPNQMLYDVNMFMMDEWKMVSKDKAESKLPPAYVASVFDKMKNVFLDKLYKTFVQRQTLSVKMSRMVTNITVELKNFESLRVVPNSKYIVDSITSKFEDSPELMEIKGGDLDLNALTMEILNAVDRDLENKMLASGQKNKVSSQFLDLNEFITVVDKISYIELKTGLNYKNFNEILDEFYFAVSSSTSGNDRGSKDIFFDERKKHGLARAGEIMIYIIVFLLIMYLVFSVYEDNKFTSAVFAKTISEAQKKIGAAKDEKEKRDANADMKQVEKEIFDEKFSLIFRSVIPFVLIVFFVCLIYSYRRKSTDKFEFNRDTVDLNTSELRSSVRDLSSALEELEGKIPMSQKALAIGSISSMDLTTKTQIYESIKKIVEKYEKCNYILSIANNNIPFPYTEIIVDALMIIMIVISIIMMYGQIDPLKCFQDIKKLNKMKEKGEYMDDNKEYINAVVSLASCHDASVDSVMTTLRIIFFIFIISLLLFYSTKVVTSTGEYKYGIYNSMYFEQSICLD